MAHRRLTRPNIRHLIPAAETEQAAKRFGLSTRQMRRIVTGESPASLPTAIRIASAYPGQVSIEELVHVSIPVGVAVRRSDKAAA